MIIIIKVPAHFKGKLLFGGFYCRRGGGQRAAEINFWAGCAELSSAEKRLLALIAQLNADGATLNLFVVALVSLCCQ